MPRTFEDYLRERRARITGWLSQRTEAELITGLCETWVRDLVGAGREPCSRHDLPHLPPELNLVPRLSGAGLCAYADALTWQIGGCEGIEPAEAPLIGHALAVAAGRAYAAHGPGKLHWIGHLVSTVDDQSWDAFAESAARALGENVGQRRTFVEFLQRVVAEANEAPDQVTEIPPRQVSMASIVEQFARGGSFQDVWQADMAPVFFRWSDAFEILRRAEPERFLELIDKLPHPVLVKECLNSRALARDPKEVLRLLQLAGVSFDVDGRWLRHGMAAILLLQLASVQLLSASNTLGNDRGFEQSSAVLAGSQAANDAEELAKAVAQFRERANDLLDSLFARSDGFELGWYWLENLLRQLPQPRPAAGCLSASKLMVNDIGILVGALSSRLVPRRTQDAWIADAEPLFRQYRAVAVLSVAAFSGEAGDLDIGAIAAGLLKNNRFELTRASELINLPGAPLRTIPGYALTRIPDVASWFTKTWSGLRFDREQAWRRATARGGVNANPAEVMALWGLGILEALAADKTQRGDLCAMWNALEAVFREARLVEPRLTKDFWCQGLARLFAWWPQLFGSTPAVHGTKSPCVEPTALGGVLAPYIGITDDFMGIVVSLHQAGIGVATLDSVVSEAGQCLLRMIHRFLETARGIKDARLWNQDWVAALRAVELAVAAQRSANEGTSDG